MNSLGTLARSLIGSVGQQHLDMTLFQIWITLTFGTDIHGPQKMKYSDFDNHLTKSALSWVKFGHEMFLAYFKNARQKKTTKMTSYPFFLINRNIS